jgi:hypothetical protein
MTLSAALSSGQVPNNNTERDTGRWKLVPDKET